MVASPDPPAGRATSPPSSVPIRCRSQSSAWGPPLDVTHSAITTRPNQDTPLMDGARVLFGNDVWEHAYYLKYQNRRADYLAAWWNVVSWDRISARLGAAQAGTLEV